MMSPMLVSASSGGGVDRRLSGTRTSPQPSTFCRQSALHQAERIQKRRWGFPVSWQSTNPIVDTVPDGYNRDKEPPPHNPIGPEGPSGQTERLVAPGSVAVGLINLIPGHHAG